MDRKKAIVGIVVAVIMVSAALYSTRSPGLIPGEVRASLVIENGGTLRREAALPAGSNVEDLMKACGVPFEKEPSGFITSINGISQDPAEGLYWIYYVNGVMGNVGASQYVIQEGDVITWKMEKF